MSGNLRATTVSLSLDDPEQAAQSPALAALLKDGWRVIADLPAQRGDKAELLLVMAPPDEARSVRLPWSVYALITAAVAIGASIGTLIGNLLP